MRKTRITITLDEHAVTAARRAVRDGNAESVSAYVNDAIVERSARDQRAASLAELIADYEKTDGVITEDEMAAQEQADRDAAARFRINSRKAG